MNLKFTKKQMQQLRAILDFAEERAEKQISRYTEDSKHFWNYRKIQGKLDKLNLEAWGW